MWLKEQGIQGGGSGTSYQAGTAQLPDNLEEKLYTWLDQHSK